MSTTTTTKLLNTGDALAVRTHTPRKGWRTLTTTVVAAETFTFLARPGLLYLVQDGPGPGRWLLVAFIETAGEVQQATVVGFFDLREAVQAFETYLRETL